MAGTKKTNTPEFKKEMVAMNHNDYISQGLSGEDALKLILCGSIENTKDATFGVVSVVFVTNNKETAQQKLRELSVNNPDNYYMVYSVPLDTDLTQLTHYPSIAISKQDLV